jgi:hypothetical protein
VDSVRVASALNIEVRVGTGCQETALVSKSGVMRAIQQTGKGYLFNEASTCCCELSAIVMRKRSYRRASRIKMRHCNFIPGQTSLSHYQSGSKGYNTVHNNLS